MGLAWLGWADGGESFSDCTVEGGSPVDDTTAISGALGTGEEGEHGLVSSRCARPRPTGTLRGWVSWSILTPRGSLGAPGHVPGSQSASSGVRSMSATGETGHGFAWTSWSCLEEGLSVVLPSAAAAWPGSSSILSSLGGATFCSGFLADNASGKVETELGTSRLRPSLAESSTTSKLGASWSRASPADSVGMSWIEFSCSELKEPRGDSPAHLRGWSSTGCRHLQLLPCLMTGLQVLACLGHFRRLPPSHSPSLAPNWLVLDRPHAPRPLTWAGLRPRRHMSLCPLPWLLGLGQPGWTGPRKGRNTTCSWGGNQRLLPRTSRACYPAPSTTWHPPHASLHGPDVQGWSDVSSRSLWPWTWQGRFHSSRGPLGCHGDWSQCGRRPPFCPLLMDTSHNGIRAHDGSSSVWLP